MSQITMTLVAKKTGQINVRIDPALTTDLDEIESKFRIGQSELVRGLVEAAVKFYRENGYFAFPVHVVPDAEFLRMVRETSPFGKGVFPEGLKEGPAVTKTKKQPKSA